jgi:hypothetical protein
VRTRCRGVEGYAGPCDGDGSSTLISDAALEELHVVLPDPIFEIAPVATFKNLLILKINLQQTKLAERIREWLVVGRPRILLASNWAASPLIKLYIFLKFLTPNFPYFTEEKGYYFLLYFSLLLSLLELTLLRIRNSRHWMFSGLLM